VLKLSINEIWIWVHFGVLLSREGSYPTFAGGVGYTCSTGFTNEEVGRDYGSTWWCSHRQYDDVLFQWLRNQLLMVEDYAYAEVYFHGELDLALPERVPVGRHR